MRPRPLSGLRLAPTVVALALAGPAAAASEDVEALREELQALRSRVEELAPLPDRVRQLEDELARARRDQTQTRQLFENKAPLVAPPEPEAPTIDLGGAVRFNYALREFTEASRSKGGDLEFDTFRIDVNAELAGVSVSAQYRWYDFQEALHHGWVGVPFGEHGEVRAGVAQVPFGLLPYASHSWWFGVPYYLGFEDDYDLGAKLLYERGPWEAQVAFFKNAEYGNPSRTERYSFDLVTDADALQANEETNQVNLRIARRLEHGPEAWSELGISGEWGQIYNGLRDDFGHRWAAGAHWDGHFGPWNLQLEAFHYEFAPRNPPGLSEESVLLGAFATSYLAPARGTVLVANVARELPVPGGLVDALTCYNDSSALLPAEGDASSFQLNTTGCLIRKGPIYTYVDLILGRNAPFLGLPPEKGFGPFDEDWSLRFNVNVGYYF